VIFRGSGPKITVTPLRRRCLWYTFTFCHFQFECDIYLWKMFTWKVRKWKSVEEIKTHSRRKIPYGTSISI